MFLVRTYLAPSRIHGLGVFAGEDIAAGQALWRFTPPVDQVLTFALVESLPPAQREVLETYTYESSYFGEGLVLNGDHARFLNHARDANTDNSGEVTLAARAIAKGEEITCDYGVCCEGFDPSVYG
jgi:SET domain-containing protein